MIAWDRNQKGHYTGITGVEQWNTMLDSEGLTITCHRHLVGRVQGTDEGEDDPKEPDILR